jgi:DNA-binding LacI/PurR family transcriptional regulator
MSALAGLERAIREAGYTLSLVRTSEHTSEKIQEAITRLVDDGVDGIALSEPTDTMDASIFIPPGIPLLTIASPEAHHSAEALVIGADQAGGAQSATEHLLALGHRTVWHISGPALWAPTRQRILGWRQALLEAEAPEPPIVEGDWTPASGFAAGVLLAERKEVTAIFAGNDHMAIGAIHAIERVGLRVPQDISVVGYDDAPESEYLSVPLTTVRQDMEEVARQGIHRLIRVIEGAPLAQRHKTLAVQLMVRSSTAPPDPRRTALTLA